MTVLSRDQQDRPRGSPCQDIIDDYIVCVFVRLRVRQVFVASDQEKRYEEMICVACVG